MAKNEAQTTPYRVNYTYIVKGKLRTGAQIVMAVDSSEAEALAKLQLTQEHGNQYRILNTKPW